MTAISTLQFSGARSSSGTTVLALYLAGTTPGGLAKAGCLVISKPTSQANCYLSNYTARLPRGSVLTADSLPRSSFQQHKIDSSHAVGAQTEETTANKAVAVNATDTSKVLSWQNFSSLGWVPQNPRCCFRVSNKKKRVNLRDECLQSGGSA